MNSGNPVSLPPPPPIKPDQTLEASTTASAIEYPPISLNQTLEASTTASTIEYLPISLDQTIKDYTTASTIECPPISHIPIDLFVRKKHQDLKRGELTFTDSSGNLVFRVDGKSSKSTPRPRRLLLDDSGNPIFSIFPCDGGWQLFKGESGEWKDLVFRVQRTYSSLLITELEVFMFGENWGDSTADFKVKGCPFQRSCTIYRGNSIVAETSLLYKLRKVIVGRRRFKLTIFPGFVDHALIVAMVVIFFDGRK